MSMQISGHGFVSNAAKSEIVVYSTNKKANQQTSAILKPANALATSSRPISHASV